MEGYASPTPQSSGLPEPPGSLKTMEMRVSRTQAELDQVMSARQSNRSLSVNEQIEENRRVQMLQRQLVQTQQELAKAKVTIHTQSQIIQNPKSGHRSLPQQNFEYRNAFPMSSPYTGSLPPPQFDPSGTIATAKNALRQSNSYNSMLQAQPDHGGQPAIRPAQTTYSQGPCQQQSNYPQPFQQQTIRRPHTNPYPASTLGTLGYGLTAEQRAQPLRPSPVPTQSHVGHHHVQNQPSPNSNQPTHSQPSSDNPSYSPQSSYPTIPVRLATKPTLPMSKALVRVTNTPRDLGFSAKFDMLFTMSERYSFAHVNFPSSAKDGMLSSYIKGKLEAAAGSSAGNLMSNGQTRYHIVARVINQWISKHVFRRTCFSGLDKAVDANIDMQANSIYQCTFPCHLLFTGANHHPSQPRQMLSEVKFSATSPRKSAASKESRNSRISSSSDAKTKATICGRSSTL